MSVTMLGNEPGMYREYLKVPEQWKRDYERLRAKNELAQKVDFYGMGLLLCGLLVVIVLRVRRDDVRWRWASRVGLAGIVLGFLAQLNEFPLHEFSYSTTDSYGSFVVRLWLNAALSALGSGGFLFVLAAGAEPLYRQYLADKMSLGALMSVRGLRTKRFFLGTILGITLTGIFIAYQTAFYLTAYRYGAWSPADVPYSDLLNTKFPWAFVLFGGFFPAVFEEFAFRMFAIPFLRKLSRSIAVAIVVAGFLWGFGHSSYPQQPFYIRGVEVGIGGVALGLVMLRFGILPTLVWHYSVDAMYSAMLLLRSESMYYKISGAAAAGIMVLPAIVALVAYLRHGGFQTEEGLCNADEVSAAEKQSEVRRQESDEETPASVPYAPLSTTARWAAVALLVLGIGAAALTHSATWFGDKPHYKIDPDRARASAATFLLGQGIDTRTFLHVTYPAVHWDKSDEYTAKYFLERLPLDRAAALFEANRPIHHWMTRYFKPLEEEEIRVSVHPESGQVLGFVHEIPEDRPGADIPIGQAREIAEGFARSRGWDLGAMELKESASEKKKARRDASFEWEAHAGDPRNVGETRFRVAIEVDGDRVTEARVYWKTPEAYDRVREQSNAISIAVAIAKIAAGAGLLVFALWLLIQGTREGIVRWRVALKVAVPALLLYPVERLLLLGLRLKSYNTAKPFEPFLVEGYLDIVEGMMGAAIALVSAAALLATFYPRAIEELRRANRRILGVDAVVSAVAATGIGLLWVCALVILTNRFHAHALMDVSARDILVSAAPAIGAVTEAVSSLLLRSAAVGLIVMMVYQARRRWMLVSGTLVLLTAMVSNDVRTAPEFALEFGEAALTAAASVAFCWFFSRRNYLAYALLLWLSGLAVPMMELIGTYRQAQGWAIVAVMALSVVWVVWPVFHRPQMNTDEHR
jgi:membrane protease YdiL (CAAX protease family)